MGSSETYRASRSALAVFGLLCGAPALCAAAAACVSPMPWTPVLVPAGAFALACLWLSRFRLTLAPEGVSYASLFLRARSVPRDKIVSVGPAEDTGPWESPLTVVVKSSSGEELRVNAKVFSREAVRRLLALSPAGRAEGLQAQG